MKDIKVTVVTVCYNSAKTIEQTIQSVLNQNYPNIEYIIIDGASTDGTLDIIKKYESKFAYWVSEPDNGIYDAMNKGIKLATGDIIGFMNSDDWYAEGAIEAIVKAFEETDADIVYGKTMIISEDESCRLMQNGKLEDICYGMVFGHPATFVKVKHLKNILFDCTYKIAADYALMLTLYHQKKSFYQVSEIIACFRLGGVSAHPWKTFMDAKKVSLNLSRNKIDLDLYRKIQYAYQEKRVLPIFCFLRERITKEKKDVIYQYLKEMKFILYGAGEFGKVVIKEMKALSLDVCFIWDSDTSKVNAEIENVLITTPVYKKHTSESLVILITVSRGNHEIADNLDGMGYREGVDYYSSHVWVRWIAGIWLGSG